ncbi:CubicO group peptidase, beta-lactamase class C family [Actinopolyspora mzabensis]|uniref:CubicO group peptidase, beta-lactamase class C family n=1 Tax=Actinopolyspora mzabensis TaxID=995066 RepID=A0A1G9EPI9_ACTMZ|nr:serine hydrolase domain-containing protein [Actinopolyspora mzabensis]SDK77998.1 CubicO group peptidase, beta-lactamase class C family [Actinopolyspora mzabensis]
MTDLSGLRTWLDENLPELARRHGVPGAAVGVLADDQVAEAAAGELNLRTGVPATADSLFQIGSVTKLWTSTLVMQLVEEGLIELDAPVTRYLPDFRLAEERAGAGITVRQLLTHTSGIYGDAFVPTTRDEDAVRRYVDDVVPTLPQDLPSGEGMSYSNSGFAVLGRIAEVVRAKPFTQLLREHIGTPLGLRNWAVTPEEALLHRTAVGHVPGGDGTSEPAPFWNLPASLAPAGTVLAMAPRELLAFAGAYLDGGGKLLDPATVERMWRPHIPVPDIGMLGGHFGLGWMVFDWDGQRVVGHDGGTYGQSCSLRVLPEAGIALASHANGGENAAFHREVVARIAERLVGLRPPQLPTPPERPEEVDPTRFAGRFDSSTMSLEVSVRPDGSAVARSEALTAEARQLQPEPRVTELVRLDDDRLIATDRLFGAHEVLAFSGGGPGSPATHLFQAGRLTRRTA